MAFKAWLYIGAVVAVLVIGSGIYWKIYNDGKQAVRIEQEKKLNAIKDKTHDAQTDALTNPNPRDELRKYSRPNE